MPIKQFKPTSPGRRGSSGYTFEEITKKRPERRLTEPLKRTGGRNSQGKLTVRHRGGGAKRLYRRIDFRRDKTGMRARVEAIEYDPNRSARIALLAYDDGEKRYILCPLGRGGQIVRSAGSGAQLMAKEGEYSLVRLPSGEMRRVLSACMATIGQVGNVEHNNIKLGKAGRARHRGWRPEVRGSAMNPRDHPHGGGEGKAPVGLPGPKSPWGKPTLGYRTRNNKA